MVRLVKLMCLSLYAHLQTQRVKLLFQCVIIPLAVPLLIVFMIVVGAMSLQHRVQQQPDVSGGIEATVAAVGLPSQAHVKAFLSVFPQQQINNYDSVPLAQSAVDAYQASYLLDATNYPAIVISTSRNRDYAHKQFIDTFHLSKAQLLTQWQALDHQLPSTAVYQVDEIGFGQAGDTTLMLVFASIFWLVLCFYASDITRSYIYMLNENDVNSDLFGHFRSLQLSAFHIIAARLVAIACLFAVIVVLFLLYLLIAVSVYVALAKALIAQLNNDVPLQMYSATAGVVNWVATISITDVITLGVIAFIVGLCILAFHMAVAIFTKDTEQARSVSKVVEFVLMMVPMTVYFLGTTPMVFFHYSVGFNGFYAALAVFQQITVPWMSFIGTSLVWVLLCLGVGHLRYFHWKRVVG